MSQQINIHRRRFLKTALLGVACAASLTPGKALAALGDAAKMKEVALHNLHTDEKLRITYWKDGELDRSAMGKINHILRDYRTGDVYPMSANLINLLHDLSMRLRTDQPFEIISGYRSPQTNAMLAAASDGVASHSLHMEGLATDIRISGVSLRRLQTEALFMQRGGVGYYPKSDFVHVDVGRVRRWG